MAEPTNLKRARKQKRREVKERVAEASRAREGQSKAERELRAKQAAIRARSLAGARLDDSGER